MNPGLPFAQLADCVRWPENIPQSERRMWKGSRRNFSAIWRVPAGAGIDPLHIELTGRYLVLMVVSGAIRLKHGSTELHLRAGQAAAVSVDELEAEILDLSYGDSVFILHFFHRMPDAGKLGRNSILAKLVEKQGRHVPGIFGYGSAGQLRFEASPAWMPESAVALLFRLCGCGLESTVRFIASGQRCSAAVKPKLRHASLSLLDLPRPVAELVW